MDLMQYWTANRAWASDVATELGNWTQTSSGNCHREDSWRAWWCFVA
jgi:hypothetical protein